MDYPYSNHFPYFGIKETNKLRKKEAVFEKPFQMNSENLIIMSAQKQ